MLRRASLRADDTLLVTGASGGVGTALIQLARRRGAKVVALCGESKAERVAELGVQAVLPRNPKISALPFWRRPATRKQRWWRMSSAACSGRN